LAELDELFVERTKINEKEAGNGPFKKILCCVALSFFGRWHINLKAPLLKFDFFYGQVIEGVKLISSPMSNSYS